MGKRYENISDEKEIVLTEVDLDEKREDDVRNILYAERPREFVLQKYQNLPEYLKDNFYITDGYRVHFDVKLCFQSLFRWHNETLSIWTHLVGFFGFFALMIVTLGVFLENPTGVDIFIFIVFLIVAQLQMLFSAVFHMFGCHSPHAYTWLAKVDYSGITLMIVGSYYPPLYYGLFCNPSWRVGYMFCISFLGVIGLIVSCIPMFAKPNFRVFRAVFFIVFGFFGVFPIPHMIWINGWDFMWPILWREGVMAACYVGGAVIYSTRIPERWYPGRFNTSWSSHPIWHVFVIFGGLFQLWTCIVCFYQRKEYPCPNLF